MGAMRKNGKKKAKQRAHAEKRRAQDQARAGASERRNASGSHHPSMGRPVWSRAWFRFTAAPDDWSPGRFFVRAM